MLVWRQAVRDVVVVALLGGPEPDEILTAVDRQIGAGNAGGHPVMSRLLTALQTMTRIGRAQSAGDLETHSPAKAGSAVHGSLLL